MLDVTQAELRRLIVSDLETIAVSGPYGSGKSAVAIPSALEWWLRETPPGSEGALIARSQDAFSAARDEFIIPWCRQVGAPMVKDDTNYWLAGRKLWRVIGNDRTSHERLKSRNLSLVVIEEAIDQPDQLVAQAFDRLRVDPMKAVVITNSTNPAHAVYTDIFEPMLDGLRDGHAVNLPLSANPVLPMGYVERQIARYSGTALFDLHVLGRWVASTGSAYPFVAESIRNEPQNEEPLAAGLGIDIGTSVPTHAVLFHHYTRGRVWASEEWVWDPQIKGPLPTGQQAEKIVRWAMDTARAPIGESISDNADKGHAFRSALQRHFRRAGHPVDMAEYHKLTVGSGVRIVERRMSDGLLFLSPRVPVLTKQMSGLTLKEHAYKKGIEVPNEEDEDHGADGLRYYVVHIIEHQGRP